MTNLKICPALFIFIAALFLSGCGIQRPETDPALDRKALGLSSQIKSFNNTILTGKGTGWVWIDTEDKNEKYRIAWAASYPDKIRITFLVSGLPVETVVSTGEKITFYSHSGSHALHAYEDADPDMGRYLKVPVKMSRIISMLLGRYPLTDFDDAYYQPDAEDRSVIVLRGSSKMQSLGLNETGNLQEIAAHDYAGNPLYRFFVRGYKTFKNTRIPSDLEVIDRHGRRLILKITGFSANPPLKEGLFRLTESGK